MNIEAPIFSFIGADNRHATKWMCVEITSTFDQTRPDQTCFPFIRFKAYFCIGKMWFLNLIGWKWFHPQNCTPNVDKNALFVFSLILKETWLLDVVLHFFEIPLKPPNSCKFTRRTQNSIKNSIHEFISMNISFLYWIAQCGCKAAKTNNQTIESNSNDTLAHTYTQIALRCRIHTVFNCLHLLR